MPPPHRKTPPRTSLFPPRQGNLAPALPVFYKKIGTPTRQMAPSGFTNGIYRRPSTGATCACLISEILLMLCPPFLKTTPSSSALIWCFPWGG